MPLDTKDITTSIEHGKDTRILIDEGGEEENGTPSSAGLITGPAAVPGATRQDELDMQRLGKKQEFRRNFAFISTLGWISIYMATWEYVLVSLASGLSAGGFAGLFWTFPATVICYGAVIACLAEMASMAPTAGGQYHWVSEFAPANCQKFLSYSAGWMSTLGWLASTASGFVVAATLIQSLVAIDLAGFEFPAWQYTLIALALLLLTIVFNTWGASRLPLLESVSLFGHFVGFVVTVVPLWIMCKPRNSAKEVFTSVVNNSGYESTVLACLIGQVTVIFCNLGSDSIVHISEEVSDSSLVVPKVMWYSYVLNTALGLVMLITMLFCIGTLDQALNSEVPYLQLFENSGSDNLAYVLIVILLILIFSGNITALATTSREVFAFARDFGFPFSTWLSKMEQKRHIPFNAVYATSFCVAVLLLINLGSSFAFNLIISLSLIALMSTYMLSIGCLLWKRITNPASLPSARWSLGRLGLPLNIFAFFYSGLVFLMACLPTSLPVTGSSANYAPAIWVGVLILSVVSYVIHGRKHFTPPVVFVEGRGRGKAVVRSTSPAS